MNLREVYSASRLVCCALLTVGTLGAASLKAQVPRQLIVVRKGEVFYRYRAGDNIRIKVKGSDVPIRSYVNNFLDDAVVVATDTIPLLLIEKTYIDAGERARTSGATMIVGGLLLFAGDQFNNSVLQDNDFDVNGGVVVVSGALIASGLALRLFSNKEQEMGYRYRLMIVKQGDPLFRP